MYAMNHTTSLYININNFDILEWFIKLVRFHILNHVYDLKATQHASEDRVFIIKPRSCRSRDEELGSIRVRTGVGHADGVRPGNCSK